MDIGATASLGVFNGSMQWAGLVWGYAPACCGRLCQSVPSWTLAVRRLYITKDGSPTRRPASLLIARDAWSEVLDRCHQLLGVPGEITYANMGAPGSLGPRQRQSDQPGSSLL